MIKRDTEYNLSANLQIIFNMYSITHFNLQ